MIPGAFAYHRPTSVKDAVGLLAKLGDDGRALAGGHSLIPMMKLRLATPANLVDLGGIAELKGARDDGNDIVIGAMMTQHELIGSELLSQNSNPARSVAANRRSAGTLSRHARRQRRQRRSRQRYAGGDDGLGATYHVIGAKGERRIAAREFYQGAYFTSLETGDVLTAIRIPVPPAVTATPMKNSSARSAITRPRRRPSY